MEDDDRLWPAEWLREFKPPDDARSNEEILAPFYAALKARWPGSLDCLISFWKSRLYRLELSGSNTRANVFYSPVKKYGVFRSDECASIVNAVKSCPYLRSLRIRAVGGISSTVIEELLSGQSSLLQELRLDGMKMHTEAEVCMVAGSIQRIKTLKTLIVRTNKLDEILLRLFPSASKSDDWNILEKLVIYGIKADEYESVANMLRRDSKLTILKLSFHEFWPIMGWLVIFEALKVNSHLKKLLRHSKFSKEDAQKVLGGLMDLLHVNYFLEEIDLEGTRLHRNGSYLMVIAQLEKNATMHRDALNGMVTMRPKGARVFLCGFPYAGKTQLCRTMVDLLMPKKGRFVQVKRRLKSHVPFFSLQRTTGIEVEVLHKADLKLSFWDLGGQDEYHAFHDLFIPNVNGYTSACSFVILCSPILQKGKFKEEKAIKQELDYWLRFISSNSTVSVKFKPHVTLVFSHGDRVPKKHDIKGSLMDIVTTLKLKFEDSLEMTSTLYFINGRSKSSVKGLATFLEGTVRKSLEDCPGVFQVCEKTQSNLAEWNINNPQKPLIKWDKFVSVCKQHGMLERIGEEDGDRLESICKAIALALHDTGDVIYFENLRFVVVNPQWFCHDIMGTILSLEEMCRTLSREKPVTDERGFIERDVLKSILEGVYVDGSILLKEKQEVVGVLGDDLIQIMMEMHLCFKASDNDINECNQGLFIPATLRGKSELKLLWLHAPDLPNSHHLGRRLECEDREQTFFTQGFFPRLQVAFVKRFASNAHCDLEQNIITLRKDGKEVLVEYCGESQLGHTYDQMDGYIDILVKSSKSVAETLKFTKEDVVNFIRKICYNSTFGCPGVKLVESILNPKCVSWDSQSRKDQSIRVDKLIEDVQSIFNSEESPNLEYLHEWPSPAGGNDKAQVLLGDVEWQDLVNKRYLELEGQANQRYSELKGYLHVLEPDGNQPTELIHVGTSKTTVPDLDPQMAILSKAITRLEEHLDKNHIQMNHRFDALERNMSKKMEEIIALQKSLLPALSRNIDKVMDFSIHLQQRQVPHLMYLTSKDVSTCEWLITSLTPGVTSAQLHFMCEHRNGIHRVAGQEGYTLILAGEAALRARPYVIWGLRVVSILAKIGGLAVAGMGSLVGEMERSLLKGFANAIPMNPLSSNFGEECLQRKLVPPNLNTPIPADDEGRAAEQWLVNTLQGKDIATLFDLHRIRYKCVSNEVAWVCGEHKVEGCRAKTMEILPV